MSNGEYQLGFAAPRRRHGEAERYVVWVLWLIGYSERSIARIMGLRPKQVAGIIGRSIYADRSSMADQERRALLDDLKAVRIGRDGKPIDGGKLDKVPWELLPLGKAQLRGPVRRKMR